MSVPACAVVIVCWNNRDYLEPCLRSLVHAQMRNPLEIVIVDNGSTDGSQEMVRTSFPQVEILQNDQNVGLGRASNQGIEATSAPYVLLLNNDTLVNGKSLDHLIEFMARNPGAGAVGGTLLNGDGSFQAASGNFPSLGEEFLVATRVGEMLWKGYPSHRLGDRIRSVGWLSSACLLLRRAALRQVGLLDDQYFIYGDETDLQYRLVKAGWYVYHLPGATTVHFGGRSMDRWRRRRMVYRGKMLFFQKNYGILRLSALRTMLAALSLAKLSIWLLALSLPPVHDRARRELRSNVDVLRLCVKLE